MRSLSSTTCSPKEIVGQQHLVAYKDLAPAITCCHRANPPTQKPRAMVRVDFGWLHFSNSIRASLSR